jgi:hypothetical protein
MLLQVEISSGCSKPSTMQPSTEAMPSLVLRVSNVVSYCLFLLVNTLANKGFFGPTNADVSNDRLAVVRRAACMQWCTCMHNLLW